ncbi:ABC transporter ATP-binding protein [Methyloraptor flagellatus]|jgi:ABC-type sugar transport system ATPase subunit|uniref:ABC transporter ATP-binding protein n=1 Tax=Methyloraptor flagellatus TaxID=3162530 RepID=A0AAU7XDQ0_9HYPH
MADLEINRLEKYYGAFHAVKGVDLKVTAGEFLVLVGPSGCGKSTLLRMIAGLEDVSSGDIVLKGRGITHAEPKDRNIAMVFQSYALYPYLTVYENIAFGLRARRVPAEEIDRRVRQAAETLHISAVLDRHPRALSGGQRQRVAIGRAIVRDADLYLFDEPLSNLDAKLRDGMREELKRLHQEIGKTFIYVTHDQIEAMTLADRIVLLNDGVIAQSGAPLDLFERPVDRFVAGFLGSPQMNILPVTVTSDREGVALADGRVVPFGSSHRLSRPEPGRRCQLGVRPEHFRTGGADGFDVTVEVVQPTGSRSYASFGLAGTPVVAELDAHAVARPGERLPLTIAMERTVLFDAASGRAVSHGSAGGER